MVGIGHDPFAALLEVLQGVAQLLGCGGSIELGHAAFQIDPLDIVVILGLADGGNQVVQSHGTHIVHAEHGVEGRTAFCPFTDRTVELNHEHRVFLYLSRRGVAGQHTGE